MSDPGTHGAHAALVQKQFSPRAASYVASPVHAQGKDLERLAAWAREHHPEHVLDLGCGGGHVSFTVAPHAGRVVACDPSSAMLEAVAKEAQTRRLGNIELREAWAERLPFEAASFELVASRFSAHHWQKLDPGLAEARRVLRPGGTAIFIDTVAPPVPLLDTLLDTLMDTWLQTIELMRDPSHVRDWSVAEWVAALQAAGFAPGAPDISRRRLEFNSWVERMATPPSMTAAIRALQQQAPEEVRRHFAIEADGSFQIDAAWLSC